jgi:hypothetical protein
VDPMGMTRTAGRGRIRSTCRRSVPFGGTSPAAKKQRVFLWPNFWAANQAGVLGRWKEREKSGIKSMHA